MSDAPARKLLKLSARFLVFFALFSGLWLAAGWIYARGLAATIDAITPLVESRHLTVAVREFSQMPEDFQAEARQRDPSSGPGYLVFQFGRQSGTAFTLRADLHFNLALLLALLFATLTNVPLKRRLLIAGVSVLLLFVYHLVEVEFYVQLVYASGQAGDRIAALFTDGERSFLNNGSNFVKFGERGFPVLIWIAVFFATQPAPAAPAAAGTF